MCFLLNISISSWLSHTDRMEFPDSLSPSVPIIFLVGLLNCIKYPHRADICKFLRVGQHWYLFLLWTIRYKVLTNNIFIYLFLYKEFVFGSVWLDLVLWHINHFRLFKVKSFLYICIKYIQFSLVWFYGITTIVGFLKPNPFSYIYIRFVWFGLAVIFFFFFFCISTILSYLKPNPFYTYILNI